MSDVDDARDRVEEKAATEDEVTAREAAELDLMSEDESEEGAEVGDHID